jgi:hypothetical protein
LFESFETENMWKLSTGRCVEKVMLIMLREQ